VDERKLAKIIDRKTLKIFSVKQRADCKKINCIEIIKWLKRLVKNFLEVI